MFRLPVGSKREGSSVAASNTLNGPDEPSESNATTKGDSLRGLKARPYME